MMTNWMHANDTLQQLFLARMIILAAAIGMGVIVFGLGAVIVRCVAWARPHLSDSYAPGPRHQSNPYPPPPKFRSPNPTRKQMPVSFNGPAGN